MDPARVLNAGGLHAWLMNQYSLQLLDGMFCTPQPTRLSFRCTCGLTGMHNAWPQLVQRDTTNATTPGSQRTTPLANWVKGQTHSGAFFQRMED